MSQMVIRYTPLRAPNQYRNQKNKSWVIGTTWGIWAIAQQPGEKAEAVLYVPCQAEALSIEPQKTYFVFNLHKNDKNDIRTVVLNNDNWPIVYEILPLLIVSESQFDGSNYALVYKLVSGRVNKNIVKITINSDLVALTEYNK